MTRKKDFDPMCAELAEHMLSDIVGARDEDRTELAEQIQDVCESFCSVLQLDIAKNFDPCSDEAREAGCTCRMEAVHSAMIDPPEPIVDRNCPLHGSAPNPDDARDAAMERDWFAPVEDDF
jgi:hypothetical protein